MKKVFCLVVATFAMFATFAATNTKKASASGKKSPVMVEATADGVELNLKIPARTTNVQIVRKDLESKTDFVCGMINFSNATSGVNKIYKDYFVEPNKAYEYTVKFIKDWNWNNPVKYSAEITNGEGGKGLLKALEEAPTYKSETRTFVGMKLKSVSLDGFNVFVNANARKTNSGWLVDDGGYNISSMGDGTYLDVTYILNKLEADIDDVIIRLNVGANKEEDGCWIRIPTDYSNGEWK